MGTSVRLTAACRVVSSFPWWSYTYVVWESGAAVGIGVVEYR